MTTNSVFSCCTSLLKNVLFACVCVCVTVREIMDLTGQ